MVWTDYIMSWILVLNFLLVCLLFISNFEHFSSKFRKVKKSTWLVFLIILIIGTGVRIMFPSCLTPDGLCWNYAGSASVFLEEGKFFDLESYTNGYPLLITFSFSVLQPSYETLLMLNLFFSCTTILLVFLISYSLFKKDEASLFSAMIFSLLPVAIYWAKEGPSEIAATFFASLSVLVFIISLDNKEKWLYVLSSLLLVFSIQVRLDNFILIPIFFFGILLNEKKSFFSKKKIKQLSLPVILFVIFMIPVFVNFSNAPVFYANEYAFPETYENYKDLFSINYMIPGLAKHAEVLSAHQNYPPFIFVFLLFSLFFVKTEKNIFHMLSWLFFFFMFYGLYWTSQVVNISIYHLLIHPPIAILAGYGIFSAQEIIVKKINSIRTLPKIRIISSVVILALIFSVFFTGTNIFTIDRNSPCFTKDIRTITEKISKNDCVLIENSKSDVYRFEPLKAMKVILYGKNIVTEIDDCLDKKMYYLNITKNCNPNIFSHKKPLLEKLENEHIISKVTTKGCIELYALENI